MWSWCDYIWSKIPSFHIKVPLSLLKGSESKGVSQVWAEEGRKKVWVESHGGSLLEGYSHCCLQCFRNRALKELACFLFPLMWNPLTVFQNEIGGIFIACRKVRFDMGFRYGWLGTVWLGSSISLFPFPLYELRIGIRIIEWERFPCHRS